MWWLVSCSDSLVRLTNWLEKGLGVIYYETAPFTLLLVERDSEVRLKLVANLKETGLNVEVIEATTGQQAIELYNSQDVGCVLLSYILSDMLGIQVLSALQDGPTLKLPVIILSHGNDANLAVELFELGAIDHINIDDCQSDLLRRSILYGLARSQHIKSQTHFLEARRELVEKEIVEKAIKQEKLKLDLAVQQLKQANKKLHFLAMHDPLTRLPNRSMMKFHLDKSIDRAKRNNTQLAIMFVDLDRFKHVNDTLGHNAGDMLLLNVTQRLQSLLRSCDLISRVGGDEFIVVVDEVDGETGAGIVAVKILQALSESFLLDQNEVFIAASIGIAIHPTDGAESEELLLNSDMAMYHAKSSGRNTYSFYKDGMQSSVGDCLLLERDLHRLVKQENGCEQFFLLYQPKIDVKNKQIIGAEVLIRWQHPEQGCISPAVFIPLAEETDLILQISDWIQGQVCEQINAWQAAGIEVVPISINVSGREFKRGHVLGCIDKIKSHHVDPHLVELEITERLIMENEQESRGILDSLRGAGISLSIDDFGTGYCSLNYLKKYPVDILKIDQSFIKNIPESSEDQAITSAIISLAHILGMKVIAEGVETEPQFQFLKGNGCDMVQGYHFYKPMPADQFVLLLNGSNCAQQRAQ